MLHGPLAPLLALELHTLGTWTVPLLGAALTGVVFLVGGMLLGRRRHPEPASRGPAVPDTPMPPASDPFLHGSSSERRQALRRGGNTVEVLIALVEEKGDPLAGWVRDRSTGGLCLQMDTSVPVGTLLSVRPRKAGPVVPWVQVEVKSCRQHQGDWEVGCQFVRTPPWAVLLQFG